MIQYLYLGRVDYGEALNLQAEISGLVATGRLCNVLILLEHPPVLTLGRNGNRANVLVSDEHVGKDVCVVVHSPGAPSDVRAKFNTRIEG